MSVEYTKVVREGVQFLDFYYPEGWRDRIDVESLDQQHNCDCVLGQIGNSGFSNTARAMWLDYDDKLAFGFTVHWDLSPAYRGLMVLPKLPEYTALTEAWKKELTEGG